MSCGKLGSLPSISRSQQGLILSKYDYFYYIFETAGPFATKLDLIVQHHKPECPVGKLGHCIQGEGHSESLECK